MARFIIAIIAAFLIGAVRLGLGGLLVGAFWLGSPGLALAFRRNCGFRVAAVFRTIVFVLINFSLPRVAVVTMDRSGSEK